MLLICFSAMVFPVNCGVSQNRILLHAFAKVFLFVFSFSALQPATSGPHSVIQFSSLAPLSPSVFLSLYLTETEELSKLRRKQEKEN
jgi:hypothetical protein